MRVGIEVGGTFTDLVAIEGGEVRVIKVPSTPRSPDIGAFNALTAAGIPAASVTDLVHGSTVATNAILERRGAPIAFVTTKGFRDILFMQRHDRRNIYDLHYAKPAPPVRRRDCFEVPERIAADGSVIAPLDEAAVRRELIPALAEGGFQAVALCLLSAYASPRHEARLKALIAEALPGLRIAASHEVAPEFREYERASTTALSAYVQPVIDGYLDRFEATLAKAGFAGHFSVMQSNGGRMPARAMRANAISALLSGPAAGVVGAIRQAARSGRGNLITFDMGGTSTDVALVQEGEASLAAETEVDGLPIRTPVLDIVTVGAGGGSLVWIDDGGMLRVGPRSAGAEPGPACYGRGGTQPTVTDAHVVRGTIRPDAFLGGGMSLDADAAHRAFEEIARRLGTDVRGAAAAAIRLAVANIVRAIQLVSTERGRDPRDYALLPFGGAGPLLAAEIAEELGIREILVPPNPGVISALGLLSADYVKIRGATRRVALDGETPGIIAAESARLRAATEAEFAALGLTGALEHSLELDMRFIGQAFEIPVAVDPAELPRLTTADLAERFAAAHRRVYLHGGEPGRKVELVGLRFGVRRRLDALPEVKERAAGLSRPPTTEVVTGGAALSTRLLDAATLTGVAGPAMIEGYSSTIWVPPGWSGARDGAGNLLLRKEG
ncbi:hydantoinase/oxoprolinase family protein [Siccirubricoccus sp. KC 17139]|uniref:Hydantoinase/oxoprolinase family protein n=1 Tax=Siccirubricoccus soli TaxID=2899147 RepID=A0ABT1D8Y5_9PROT|nr:hydantoinase/oxoprolinase family protein [Siccirubricoccus soli]MCO6418389.1 hydantoinase/oxoprolinase family protein [Siccirubricoccus soli]MCP2684524.1 hydantoinase/oxoprolinase family protein [Siccirubricoccus soli]